MSFRPTKNGFFAGLSLAILWSSQVVQVVESQACSVLNVYGANGVIGAGFGVNKSGTVPRTGTQGDAGEDATVFRPGKNPNPVCGTVALLHGAVDIAKESHKVDHAPTVWSNASIPLDIFQVNRNGGGPGIAEVSTDATGNSFEPADVTLNLPGNDGAWSANRQTVRVVVTLREGTTCTGGKLKNRCLIRFRAGLNDTCGGCFLVKMEGTVKQSSSGGCSAKYTLSARQISILMDQSITLAKQDHLVAPKPKHKKRGHHL